MWLWVSVCLALLPFKFLFVIPKPQCRELASEISGQTNPYLVDSHFSISSTSFEFEMQRGLFPVSPSWRPLDMNCIVALSWIYSLKGFDLTSRTVRPFSGSPACWPTLKSFRFTTLHNNISVYKLNFYVHMCISSIGSVSLGNPNISICLCHNFWEINDYHFYYTNY